MLPADELRLGVRAEVSNAVNVNANSMDLFLNIFPLLFEEIDDPCQKIILLIPLPISPL
jgi:hypothetical protein